jgi:hypothetical protein
MLLLGGLRLGGVRGVVLREWDYHAEELLLAAR